jgi:putative ABC transport system ATP-binding protein
VADPIRTEVYAMVAPPDDEMLSARSLHYAYGGSPALAGVSLGVREGQFLAVEGARGSGRTTLLRCLSGQLVPSEGEVLLQGHPVHTLSAGQRDRLRRDRFGWIGPEPHLVAELTAWENAALPLLLRGVPSRRARAVAVEWLERLDIGPCARSRPAALGRGECQRIAVARALAGEPAVIFADEPTAALHRQDRSQVARTLATAARSHGITVVMATTDEEAVSLADVTVTLADGRRTDGAASEEEGRAACSLSV